MSPLRLAGVHVRDVHFHERQSDTGERITDGETRMTVGPSIHHGTLDASAQRMNVLHELPLAVSLNELERCAKLARDVVKSPFDVGECLGSINGRLAYAEEIEVRTIDDRDPHVFFNPSSQALNCWMSSLSPALSSVVGAASDAATSCCACCEKNWSKENECDWLPAAGVA